MLLTTGSCCKKVVVAVLLLSAVCAEVRGCSSFLFGLRVAEEARGNGVASNLMVSTALLAQMRRCCRGTDLNQVLDLQAADGPNPDRPGCCKADVVLLLGG